MSASAGLDGSGLLAVLRCPVTGQKLVSSQDESLVTRDGTRRYPVSRGVPIIIAPGRSLFAPEAHTSPSPADTTRHARRGASLRAARTRVVPSISRNVKGRQNFRELARHLTSQSGTKRVLVVGGAVRGVGIEELLAAPGLEIFETDVILGPSTQVVCDAHDLPFADGGFDAVVCQAVLGHVADPNRVVSEIHRVLAPNGLVYSETSFLQGVNLGPYDFTRYTHVGHLRLFREFDRIASGVQCGPGMALAWSVVGFFTALAGRSWVARAAARTLVPFFVFWLTYLDPYLVDQPGGYDAASGTFFLGRRRDHPLPDEEIIRGYRGGIKTDWLRP